MPYPLLAFGGITVADGIPMSCSNTNKTQPSLKFVHQSIAETVYPGERYNAPLDLKVWSNQGVLLMNIALTTTVGRTGVHYLLWRPFIVHILDTLGWNKPGLTYVFVGKKAQEYSRIIPSNTYKFNIVHPAYAAHQHLDKWDCLDIWNRVNMTLEKNGIEKIKW